MSLDESVAVSDPLHRIRLIQRQLAALSHEIADWAEAATPAPAPCGDAALEELARGLLWQRGVMAQHLDAAHFVDPASNLMLFLYGAGADAAPSAGECCAAARVPRTTALRWIGILEGKGLLKAIVDPTDRRRTSVTLTDAGRATMRRCLTAIAEAPVGGLSL